MKEMKMPIMNQVFDAEYFDICALLMSIYVSID